MLNGLSHYVFSLCIEHNESNEVDSFMAYKFGDTGYLSVVGFFEGFSVSSTSCLGQESISLGFSVSSNSCIGQ